MKSNRSRLGAALAALAGLIVVALAWISEPVISFTAPPQRSAETAGEGVRFIKSLVDRISVEELKKDILALQSAGTRFSPSRGNAQAAEYIKSSLLAAGIKDVRLDEFAYYDDQTGRYETSRNVVATKPGIKAPGRIVILCAHFDSISRRAEQGQISALDIENPAPGADDNGTGVAAMLAAARHFSPYEFDCTLRFVAFSAEEAGIFGSAHYAAEFEVGRYPTDGCFNVDGTRYYQPYWGERFVDVIDTTTLARVARIASPSPLSKLIVAMDPRRAVGMSAESGSIVVFDLASGKAEKLISGLIEPSDVVLVNDQTALVSSGRNAVIYQIDLVTGRITGQTETGLRPAHLLLSPQRDILVALHKLGSCIDIFNVNTSNGGAVSLERKRVLDTGDEIVGGTFAGNTVCYFISSNRSRLFGFDLSGAEVFWAMRTGGVRASAEVEKIVFVGE